MDVVQDMTGMTQVPGWRRALRSDLAWVLVVGLASRIELYLLAWLFNLHFDLGRDFSTLLCSWDCGWYWSIFAHGYQLQPDAHPAGDAANWAFFPLFPYLVRWFSQASGVGVYASAMLITNVSFIIALVVLHAYARAALGGPTARFVVIALAFSPFALYFSAPYTEALYLLLMVAAMHLAQTGRWVGAGLCAAALSGTRNLGVFIVLPMLMLGVAQFGWRRLARVAEGTERFYLGLALAPLGLFGYMLFLHLHVGDALAFKHVQVAWGGTVGNPLAVIADAVWHGDAYARYCAVSAGVGLGVGVWLYRRGLRAEALILIIGTLIPASVRVASVPRYVFTLFPLYLALGLALRESPRAQWLVFAALLPLGGFTIASWVAQKTYMI